MKKFIKITFLFLVLGLAMTTKAQISASPLNNDYHLTDDDWKTIMDNSSTMENGEIYELPNGQQFHFYKKDEVKKVYPVYPKPSSNQDQAQNQNQNNSTNNGNTYVSTNEYYGSYPMYYNTMDYSYWYLLGGFYHQLNWWRPMHWRPNYSNYGNYNSGYRNHPNYNYRQNYSPNYNTYQNHNYASGRGGYSGGHNGGRGSKR